MDVSFNSFLEYFATNFHVSEPGDILWSHAVNDQYKLRKVLLDPQAMIIESDIRISPEGKIIAVHPPAITSDLTFEELVKDVMDSDKGLKLDFKDPETVVPSLELLHRMQLQQPVILNADILQGNGASPSRFNSRDFIDSCERLYPSGFLSLGWTTVADPRFSYTSQNIGEMLELCEGLETVTLPVRACLLPTSWTDLQRIMAKDGYTLTVWNNEPVDIELQNWIRQHTNPGKTFYDFINENKEPLRFW